MAHGQTALAMVKPPQAPGQISFLYHALSTLYFFITHSFAYPQKTLHSPLSLKKKRLSLGEGFAL
jgi:hypothetical protein